MKRYGNLYEKLISDENLKLAIYETNRGHRWRPGHKPNKTALRIEGNIDETVEELKSMIENGFCPTPLRTHDRWDTNAKKWRKIAEPSLWPDQYIHHAMIQVLQPIFLKGMDYWCCGSVQGRGINRGKRGIERWIREDIKGTRWCASLDIKKFYDSLNANMVYGLLKRKVKDHKFLDFVWRVIKNGFVAGTYFAQWFANFSLQELDHVIRENNATSHYVRYMDNMTIFGSSKRGLHRLRKIISDWLEAHLLRLKEDWQIFRVSDRQPSAMGYRYSRIGTRLKKQNRLRLIRNIKRVDKKLKCHKWVSPKQAAGVLSRLGQMKHCSNYNFFKNEVPVGLQRKLKNIIRQESMLTYGYKTNIWPIIASYNGRKHYIRSVKYG